MLGPAGGGENSLARGSIPIHLKREGNWGKDFLEATANCSVVILLFPADAKGGHCGPKARASGAFRTEVRNEKVSLGLSAERKRRGEKGEGLLHKSCAEKSGTF